MPSPKSKPNTAQTPHLARCNDVAPAAILSEHITQPMLKQLASRLQMSSLAEINSNTPRTYKLCSQLLLSTLKNTPIADASVLVAITYETTPRLLLTRRAGHLNAHAGEVSFAGGKYEPTDDNNMVTALREAYEETALPLNCVQIIGQLPIQTSKSGLSVRPIVALVPPTLTLVPELGEIERIFWADFKTLLLTPVQDYEVPYTVNGNTKTLLTPSWQVDGEVVWGLTGRILASLFELGFDKKIAWYYKVKPTN